MDGRVADRVLQVVHSQRILTAATQAIVETGRASTRPGQASNRPGQHQTDLGPAGRFSGGQPPPAAHGMDGAWMAWMGWRGMGWRVEPWLAVGGIQGARRACGNLTGHARGSKLSAGPWDILEDSWISFRIETTSKQRAGWAGDGLNWLFVWRAVWRCWRCWHSGPHHSVSLPLSIPLVSSFSNLLDAGEGAWDARLSAERSGGGCAPVRPSNPVGLPGRGTSNNSGYSACTSRCRSRRAMTSEASRGGKHGGTIRAALMD